MPKNYLTGRKSYSNINSPAEVVKLVDTQRSGRCARKGMGVRVPPSALHSVSAWSTSGLRRFLLSVDSKSDSKMLYATLRDNV